MSTPADTFAELVRSAGFAADLAALATLSAGETQARVTAAAVEAAFAHALGNGLITLTDRDKWPELRRIEITAAELFTGEED